MAGEDLNADDPYDVLGVSHGATEDEVKSRTRDLLDKYSDDHAARKTINDAFEEIQERPSPVEVGGTVVVPLLVSVTPDTVEVGEEFEIHVTDHANNDVSGVGLQREDGKQLGKTDDNGRETRRFNDAGTYTLIASKRKHPEPDHEYKDGKVDVEIKRKRGSLSFDSCPDQVEVGEDFEVIVVDSNDNPAGNATVTTDAGSSTSTNGKGEATLTADRVGQLTIEASKSPTSAKRFTRAETTVSVNERQVDLQFAQSPSRVSVDSRGTFRVTNSDDRSPVRGVEVSVGASKETTDDNGEATLSFSSVTPGTRTVTASKENTGGLTFSDAQTDIKVKKQTNKLEIQPLSSDIVVDEPTRFKVTASGSPVQQVTVRSFDGDVDETDGDGIARLTFDSFGQTTVIASKADSTQTVYEQGRCSVDVERTTKQLRITNYESTEEGTDIEVGDDVTVEVATVGGSPVKGAKVDAQDGTSGKTGPHGRATVTFSKQGRKQLIVSKSSDQRANYKSHTEHVDVKQRTKELSLEGVNAPKSVSAGEPVTFRVVDELGNELSDITVYAKDKHDQRKKTNGDGEVTFEFKVDRAQFIEIYARPDDDQFDRYDSKTIRVTP